MTFPPVFTSKQAFWEFADETIFSRGTNSKRFFVATLRFTGVNLQVNASGNCRWSGETAVECVQINYGTLQPCAFGRGRMREKMDGHTLYKTADRNYPNTCTRERVGRERKLLVAGQVV